MSKNIFFPPKKGEAQFHCPHCNVFAKQRWSHMIANSNHNWHSFVDDLTNFQEWFSPEWSVSKCEHCSGKIIWNDEEIIYPRKIIVENPNLDLSEEIRNDYLEAARVFNESPRAAAALLRLALQKLCKQLGEKGDNINDDIKNLVKKGLNPLVQKSLDSLRITGNNAVHPSQINTKEQPKKVLKLFNLLNFIADKMISEPKEISDFYEELPQKSKNAISKRDNK